MTAFNLSTEPSPSGNIISYNISTGIETVLQNFTGPNGNDATGSLMKANNGLLYGMTQMGGAYNYGIIFSYNIATGIETVLHDFVGDSTDGRIGCGSLIQATDGLLYGMTQYGGAYHGGTIFSFNIVTGIETVIHHFAGNPTDGSAPYGALFQASDGLLYGMTRVGGANICYSYLQGTIFSYNIATATYNYLYNFDGLCNNDGGTPYGSFIQAGNGLLYGMTQTGGINNNGGTIFSYNIATNAVTVLYSFSAPLTLEMHQPALSYRHQTTCFME